MLVLYDHKETVGTLEAEPMTTTKLVRRITSIPLVLCAFSAIASQPLPQDLQLVSPELLPTNQATWFSLQKWDDYPPSPFNWLVGSGNIFYYQSASFGTNKVIIDDTAIGYSPASSSSAMVAMNTSSGPPLPPGGGGGGGGGTNITIGPVYGENDYWLQLVFDTNNAGFLSPVLHAATNGMYYELFSRTNVTASTLPWSGVEMKPGVAWTNDLWFLDVSYASPPMNFFRTEGASNAAKIYVDRYFITHAVEPDANGNNGTNATFDIRLYEPAGSNGLTVYYVASGQATDGLDYTNDANVPYTFANGLGSVRIPEGSTSATITVHPLHDPQIDFDEIAFFKLFPTNGYVADAPLRDSIGITISDNFGTTNLFEVVATNIPGPIGIDYDPSKQSLLLSVNYSVDSTNFALLSTNGVLSYWSPVQGVGTGREIKIATVKNTINAFTNGDLFYDTGSPGGIGWASSNGVTFNVNWDASSAASTESDVFAGDLYVDQTGIWSNDLFAVTGDDVALGGTRGVWRIHNSTNATLITRIPSQHLEGILTVSNNPAKYGPWAGKLLTGDDFSGLIYAIDTNGNWTAYDLGIAPDTIRQIPPTNDLYCVDYNKNDASQSIILKVSRKWLTNYVGDILMVQAGENGPQVPSLFIVHWNGTWFDIHGLALHDYRNNNGDFFEKAAFAPITLPTIAP